VRATRIQRLVLLLSSLRSGATVRALGALRFASDRADTAKHAVRNLNETAPGVIRAKIFALSHKYAKLHALVQHRHDGVS